MKDEGIYMSKKGQLQFETVSEFLQGKITRSEAAMLLDTTERTITRISRRIEKKGIFGVIHGNREREPWNKGSEELKGAVMKLMMERYYDCNMTHALEKIKAEHGITVPYEMFRRWCHEREFVKRAKRRRPQPRYKRVRMPAEGLLLQMDGSPYRYNGKDEWCLIAAIDDATSDIPYAEFFLSEDTLSCMTVLEGILRRKGIPHALYVDHAGCLGGGAKRAHFNQFRRACEELSVRIIQASSPEAKGRIERAWDTFQDRLVPELRLRNIKAMPKANEYLQTEFIPNYWRKKLTLPPRDLESKYRPLPAGLELKEILCLKEFRSVKHDHTLSWEGRQYLISSPLARSIWKQKIELRTYQDLSCRAFFADREIELTPIDSSSLPAEKTQNAA